MAPLSPKAVLSSVLYEREFVLAERMLLFVRFFAPRGRGTIMPSSLIPHIANILKLSSTVSELGHSYVIGHHFFVGSLIE